MTTTDPVKPATRPQVREVRPPSSPLRRLAAATVGSAVPGRPGSTLGRNLLWAAVGALVVYFVSYGIEPFRNYQLATAAAYLTVTAGLTVLTGLNGQLSLGHGALMATGAYTVALMQNSFSERGVLGQWTLVVSLLAAVVVASLVGGLVGVAAARLRGPYLAGVTLALALVVPAFTTYWDDLFGADQGLSVFVPPKPAALGQYFPVARWQAWTAVAAAIVVLVLLANLTNSRFGRAFKAVRDDEVAAQLAGIHVARTQVQAFVVSAGAAGLGGGVLAAISLAASPSMFGLTLSLNLLLAIVLGGLGSLVGAAWGAMLLVAMPYVITQLTRTVELDPKLANKLEGNLPLAIFGITLIVVMLVAPGGIQGAVRRLGHLLGRLLRARRPAST